MPAADLNVREWGLASGGGRVEDRRVLGNAIGGGACGILPALARWAALPSGSAGPVGRAPFWLAGVESGDPPYGDDASGRRRCSLPTERSHCKHRCKTCLGLIWPIFWVQFGLTGCAGLSRYAQHWWFSAAACFIKGRCLFFLKPKVDVLFLHDSFFMHHTYLFGLMTMFKTQTCLRSYVLNMLRNY
jgi:hypothetical protein